MTTRVVISEPLGNIQAPGDLPLGGPGSGNWGHAGPPGMVGGSTSKSGAPQYQVGITSARPGKSVTQVAQEMGDFRRELEKAPITDLSVHLGVGGWEGGSEPTYVTQYTGNGEARKVLARFAKQHEQDGVLVQKYVNKGTAGAGPQNRVIFNADVTASEAQKIEKFMVENGIGGWTWGRSGGKPMLMMTYIKEWSGFSGPDEHRAAVRKIANLISKTGQTVKTQERQVLVEIMEKGDYDDIIAE